MIAVVALMATVSLAPPAFAAVPAVDPYQSYVDPGCMSFVEQPGVRAFRDMIMSRVGGTNGGIFACSGYEHGEGRAWDWMRNANDATQAQQVQQVLDWLLATDAAGNPHAMARRLGIGNIIWNRRSISLWTSSGKVWNNYPCDGSPGSCHTNHVHFAFSWAGARQQTTWFTTADRPGDWYPDGVGAGSAYHRVRLPDGSWTPFASLAFGSVSKVATATDQQSRAHTLAVQNGQVWHRLRHADGTWTPWAILGNPGTASSTAASADIDGNLHVVIAASGTWYHRVRRADTGSWTPWANPGGSIGAVTATGAAVDLTRNVTHVTAVANGQAWHRLRNADGTWTPWGLLGNPGTASTIAASTDAAGTLHLAITANGTWHHRVRMQDTGNWTPWANPGGSIGTITAISAAVDLARHVTHFAAIGNGQLWHRVRYADGTWTPWAILGTPGAAAMAIAVSTDPAGALHTLAAAR
jgi:hypothetical protein